MRTLRFAAKNGRLSDEALAACARILERGGLVAFPTETVYGLGADALNPEAVRAIFRVKGRPADNPLIVHTHDARSAFKLARRVSPLAERLGARFWPGPLTLVVERAREVPDDVTAGLDTVALRVPSHPVARQLLAGVGRPLAAPSANASGRPSPTCAEHVLEDLDGKIDAVIDGGPTGVGVESTVVDVSKDVPRILRYGGVPPEALEALVGRVDAPWPAGSAPLHGSHAGSHESGAARSPGQKYRHYAPKASLYLITGDAQLVEAALVRLAGERPLAAFLVSEETARRLGASPAEPGAGHGSGRFFVLGARGDLKAVASRLYRGLRELDRLGPPAIFAETFPPGGLGATVADRLARAAEGRLIPAEDVLSGAFDLG